MRILLGPILFVLDVAPENVWWGVALTILLVPAIVLFAFRRRVWTAVVSIMALAAWLILGVVGGGIDA
jgi:hypothetical protein